MVIIAENQVIKKDLENILRGLQTDYQKAVEINDKESLDVAIEYLGGALTESKREELSNQLYAYMSGMDVQMQLFNEILSDSFVKNKEYDVISIERELKILFLKENGSEYGRSIPVSRYIPDQNLHFNNTDVSPIKHLVPSIQNITETHNQSFYLNARSDIEFRFSSRVKKYVTEKLLRYIFKEDGFPRDFGGNKLIFKHPRHLYEAVDTIKELSSGVLEENYRNLPEKFNTERDILKRVDKAITLAIETDEPTNEQREEMIVGIWLDYLYNNIPMEIQLMTERSSMIMDIHSALKHKVYKENNKRNHQGLEKRMENFLDQASSSLLEPLNYRKQRERLYSQRDLYKPAS